MNLVCTDFNGWKENKNKASNIIYHGILPLVVRPDIIIRYMAAKNKIWQNIY